VIRIPPYMYLATVCVVMIAGGQLLFKLSTNAMKAPGLEGLLNPRALVLLGFALFVYAAATLAWVWILRQAPLNKIYPFMALAFVLVPLGSRVFLGEPLAPQYWAGVALLVAGLVLITRASPAG
jgi:drug/metabolite transporter (DMT)-like permease